MSVLAFESVKRSGSGVATPRISRVSCSAVCSGSGASCSSTVCTSAAAGCKTYQFSPVDAFTDVTNQFYLQAGVNTLWLKAREACTLARQLTVA